MTLTDARRLWTMLLTITALEAAATLAFGFTVAGLSQRLPAPGLVHCWVPGEFEFRALQGDRRCLAGSRCPLGRFWKRRATSSAGHPRRRRGCGHMSPSGYRFLARTSASPSPSISASW